jgi:hypothetical protein
MVLGPEFIPSGRAPSTKTSDLLLLGSCQDNLLGNHNGVEIDPRELRNLRDF